VKITDNWKWSHWPFTQEQALTMQKQATILLRIKIISLVLFIIAAILYFFLHITDVALSILVGGIIAILYSIYYYRALKSGKIIFEK
jgi:F0F1-type ATP synthase assembly protein I